MDLEELKGVIISQKKTLQIVKEHGNSSFSELGNKKKYEALEVYYFLGH